MRVLRTLLLVALVLVASAGCAERTGSAVRELRGQGGPPEPYFMEYREAVAPDHNASYPAPVAPGAVALQVDLDLAATASASPGGPALALLTVALLSPTGETLARREADARTPAVSLGLTQFPATGIYEVRVTGSAIPDVADPLKTGASYVLTVEVVYA